ncbi:MAG: hypothetical protein LBI38_02070 [Oscillospiraceae bacterium]|jgi:D-alanyl-D-alanine carboxypeptidase (penicillin-binding protein 5/6)|nr:hypothetical protein [Oscillospiraceae bacterium]
MRLAAFVSAVSLILALAACENISVPADVTDTGDVVHSPTEERAAAVETPAPRRPERIELYGTIAESALNSRSVYFYNVSAGYPVFSKNEDMSVPPASVLKIMTCLITLENVSDLDATVEVPYACFEEFYSGNPNKEDTASAGIAAFQDNLTYRDCLYGLMTASGCDASNVLAYNAGGGDIGAFIGMMNAKAAELGCAGTNFTNAHGLFEPDNYSCARDIFLITEYACENYPAFMEICGAESYEMPPNAYYPDGYVISSFNPLTQKRENNPYYYGSARALKTGSIDYFYEYVDGAWEVLGEGVTSLVSYAVYDGELYVAVTLGAPFYFGPYTDGDGNSLARMHYTLADHKLLYETAFGKAR